MNEIKELAETLSRPHKLNEKIFSRDRKWCASYNLRFDIIIGKYKDFDYKPAGNYSIPDKIARAYPAYKNIEEIIINAFWLATGEIVLTKEQYLQGYASLLYANGMISEMFNVNLSRNNLLVYEKDSDKIHTFTIQGGDEYVIQNYKTIFRYRIKFLHIVHSEDKYCYKKYYRETVSPYELKSIISEIPYSEIFIKGNNKKSQ